MPNYFSASILEAQYAERGWGNKLWKQKKKKKENHYRNRPDRWRRPPPFEPFLAQAVDGGKKKRRQIHPLWPIHSLES